MSNLARKIYIGGLHEDITEQILYSVFLTFGEIKTVEIPKDRETKKHKGFAFIEFEDEEDPVHAIDNMHESQLFGRIIKVQKARKDTAGK
jgi:peptidyl-prolyl isomerase E (cyclophilin E)